MTRRRRSCFESDEPTTIPHPAPEIEALAGPRTASVRRSSSWSSWPEHPVVPDVRGRSVHRPDRLDGPDPAGRPRRDRLPELRRSVSPSGYDEEGRSRPRRSAPTAAAASSTRPRRSTATATVSSCRSFCTTSAARGAGRSRSSTSRASRRRRTSSEWSGLPGESIQIVGGDIYDRRPDRPQDARASSGPCASWSYDNNFVPEDDASLPAWRVPPRPDRAAPAERLACRGGRFVHEPIPPAAVRARACRLDRIPSLGPGPGPLRPGLTTSLAYNGGELRGENAVDRPDGRGAARRVGPTSSDLPFRIDSGSDRFFVELPVRTATAAIERHGGTGRTARATSTFDRTARAPEAAGRGRSVSKSRSWTAV